MLKRSWSFPSCVFFSQMMSGTSWCDQTRSQARFLGFQAVDGRLSTNFGDKRQIGSSRVSSFISFWTKISFGYPFRTHFSSCIIAARLLTQSPTPSVARMCHPWPFARCTRYPSSQFNTGFISVTQPSIRTSHPITTITIQSPNSAICLCSTMNSRSTPPFPKYTANNQSVRRLHSPMPLLLL